MYTQFKMDISAVCTCAPRWQNTCSKAAPNVIYSAKLDIDRQPWKQYGQLSQLKRTVKLTQETALQMFIIYFKVNRRRRQKLKQIFINGQKDEIL